MTSYSPKIQIKSNKSVVIVDRFKKIKHKKGFDTLNMVTVSGSEYASDDELEEKDQKSPRIKPVSVLNDFIGRFLDECYFANVPADYDCDFGYQDWSTYAYDLDSGSEHVDSWSCSDQDSWG